MRRLDASRWYLRLSWVEAHLGDSIVTINQTRSQKDKVFKNKKNAVYSWKTSYKVRALLSIIYIVTNVQMVE